jgi:hypothetical protein
MEKEIVEKLHAEIDQKGEDADLKETEFVFNVIDSDFKKRTSSLSVEKSGFLLKRLEQLAKEAVDKNLDI